MTIGRVRQWVSWIPALAWAAVIFQLSSMPSPPTLDRVSDKQAHAFAYAILALACIVGLTGASIHRVTRRVLVTAVVMSVIYGASDELHQLFVEGRSAEVADLVADALGALLAAVLVWAWAILVARRPSVVRRW